VPAQYAQLNGSESVNLMVFQDGRGFVNEKGHTRVPVVFDNLIHSGDLPVTIALPLRSAIALSLVLSPPLVCPMDCFC
tara:strand:+ start:154 stop:387 length:234 start_codon:yes stop_codon:yes gene_type:complete